MARILITCFGSYGDLFPYIALGKELQKRNHVVVLGTTSIFQNIVESEGLPFTHIRCGLDRHSSLDAVRELMQKVFDPFKGGEYFIREMMNGIDATYEDTRLAAMDADFVISNPFAFATPLVCSELNIPWFSTILAPMFFMSTYDPPTMSAAPWMKSLHTLSPAMYRGLFKLIKRAALSWAKPLYELCTSRQLPFPVANPLFEGQFSPHGTLAMFPKRFAEPQPDWPDQTILTGFPIFSAEKANLEVRSERQVSELEEFLNSGEPPLVFAMGSSAVHIARDFFETSARIATKLNRRAVLVAGALADGSIEAGKDHFVIDYVPYDKLFPRASVIIHQAGIGTLAQAIHAQKPMLIVPFGFDQFDNAERMEHLGIALTCKRKDYTIDKASILIEQLATNDAYTERAIDIGSGMQCTSGVIIACNAIEDALIRQLA
ncbi:MAG TPA: glycosyltransferase [Gallionella sp.]|nr:glycosyltransferase [Gallionella sp.]